MNPPVSVCIPAYQAADHLQETLDSVWGQDFEDFELVVVDDGSTDATAEILAAQADPRLRFHRLPRNLGQRAAVATMIGHARGDLVKLLDADDLLRRDCVGRMAAALQAHPGAAFVFSRRDVLTERPDDPLVRRWIAHEGDLHGRFDALGEVNDGREMLRRYLEAGLPGNWIAEPAGVMARRADLLAVGGYNRKVRLSNDMDLWVRLMARGDVLFIDEPLYSYRFELSGVTGGATEGARYWLDRLWMAEGLFEMEEVPEAAVLGPVRRALVTNALRRALLAPLREPRQAPQRVEDLCSYGAYRLARRAGRAEPLHLAIGR